MKEMKNFTKPELNSQETPPVSSYKTYAIFITHSRDVPTFLESPQEIFKAKNPLLTLIASSFSSFHSHFCNCL